MKTNFLFNLVVFSSIIVLSACQNNTTSSTPSKSTGDPVVCRDTITAHHPVDSTRVTYRIREACAIDAIASYMAFVETAKNDLPQPDRDKLIYGAYVDRYEMNQVLKHYERENYDSLFVMIGLFDSIPELLFALQPSSAAHPSMRTLYFDFTIPCPSVCPN